MRASQQLTSAIHAFLVYVVMFFGLFLIGLKCTPGFRLQIAERFAADGALTLFLGIVFVAVGILLSILFFALYRQRYFTVSMQPYSYSVDTKLIAELLGKYLLEKRGETVPAEVFFANNGEIKIILHVDDAQLIDNDFLMQCQNDIGHLLLVNFNYQKPFTVSFAV